jgi:hypothetical protein
MVDLGNGNENEKEEQSLILKTKSDATALLRDLHRLAVSAADNSVGVEVAAANTTAEMSQIAADATTLRAILETLRRPNQNLASKDIVIPKDPPFALPAAITRCLTDLMKAFRIKGLDVEDFLESPEQKTQWNYLLDKLLPASSTTAP